MIQARQSRSFQTSSLCLSLQRDYRSLHFLCARLGGKLYGHSGVMSILDREDIREAGEEDDLPDLVIWKHGEDRGGARVPLVCV